MNETTTLYYREGSSDKVYHAAILPKDRGFIVHFAYGRRGATLQTGTKTQAPVDHAKAKDIFDKLVREKMAKGYTPGANGTPYAQTSKEERVSGISCQLLNPVGEEMLEKLILHPDYWMQEKYDGKRILVRKSQSTVEGINRKGLIVGLPETVLKSAQALPGTFILDGEAVGDLLHVFDLLEHNGEDLRLQPYRKRYIALLNLVASGQAPHLRWANTTCTPVDKRAFLKELREQNKEGAVFKDCNAPYTPGRPASGGPQLKHKFYATASFIVSQVNGKRSVGLELWKGVEAGNVTIPGKIPMPEKGEIVEVRYLYAFRESGRIFQPVYLGVREDVEPKECTTSQLKYRNPTSEDEEN